MNPRLCSMLIAPSLALLAPFVGHAQTAPAANPLDAVPDKMPFDFHEVLAAIAPRGIYVNAPLADSNFDVGGVRKCIAAAQPVFDLLGAKDQLVVEYPDCGHDFPDEVRERVYQWLEQQLK